MTERTARPNQGSAPHVPVLLPEVLDALSPRDGGIYVDGTFGAGGYSRAILESADCQVWGIDRDSEAVAKGRGLAAGYAGRLHLVEGCFGDMDRLLPPALLASVQGIALDLGVSSMQIDQAGRGFSFRSDGPLDMRMEGPNSRRPSASEVVNELPEAELSRVIGRYGEERKARQVARAIVAARSELPIERTAQLADIVRSVVRRGAEKGIDPATRTFQGLRIYVNDELGELERGLRAAERLLAPGGYLAVVSFHSLEDRIAKDFLKTRSGQAPRASRHLPEQVSPCAPRGEGRAATFTLLFRGAKKPTDTECRRNPRARSARLRAAERTAAPAWEDAA